jgi:hypothetical protein
MLEEAEMGKQLWMALLAATLMLDLGSAGLILAQDEIDITGSIRGRDGGPKRFASVQMEGSVRYVAITNAEGQFKVSKVVPGHYAVRVRQGDHVETFSVEVRTRSLDLVVKW